VRWVVVFVAGAIGGAALDQIHVQSGVLAYAHPWFADQAWWVAPQFGAGLLLVYAAAHVAVRRDPRNDNDTGPQHNRVLTDAACFVAVYAASGIWHQHPVALTAAFVATWLARRPNTRTIAFSIVLAIGGVLYEGSLAGSGAFHYADPDLYHVPMWLAGIYFHGARLALSVVRASAPATAWRRPGDDHLGGRTPRGPGGARSRPASRGPATP
jgi:hypothetical protein